MWIGYPQPLFQYLTTLIVKQTNKQTPPSKHQNPPKNLNWLSFRLKILPLVLIGPEKTCSHLSYSTLSKCWKATVGSPWVFSLQGYSPKSLTYSSYKSCSILGSKRVITAVPEYRAAFCLGSVFSHLFLRVICRGVQRWDLSEGYSSRHNMKPEHRWNLWFSTASCC